jgi:ribosomal protein S18 acetylase RimI-like enzyme
MGEAQITPLTRRGGDLRRFLRLSHAIYQNDPHWVAPLMMDLKKIFADANPLFDHAEMQLWIAERDGRDVGRIAGIVDRHFNQFHKDHAAFFGFFECVNDRTVSQKLFAAASDWSRSKGMQRILGPLNPTTNEECGLLVDGFDSPPVLMTTYNPPYYADLIAAEGFMKGKNLFAFAFDLANTPMERFERIAAKVSRRAPEITVVPVTRRNLEPALAQVKEIYNEAWQKNWGFVPMTDAEINFLAARLKPLLTEGLAYVASNAHEPVGFLLALPDFNQAIKPLKGRLLTPKLLGFLPYLFGWKVPDACRVITLGVKQKYQGRGIETAMLAEGLRTGFKLGFRTIEASWILEDNLAVQRLIELFGGKPYKTYRIYERAL